MCKVTWKNVFLISPGLYTLRSLLLTLISHKEYDGAVCIWNYIPHTWVYFDHLQKWLELFFNLHWETTHYDDNLAAVVMIDLYSSRSGRLRCAFWPNIHWSAIALSGYNGTSKGVKYISVGSRKNWLPNHADWTTGSERLKHSRSCAAFPLYSVSLALTKNVSRMDNWWPSNRIMGAQG